MKKTYLFFLLILLILFQASCKSLIYGNNPVKESRFMLNTIVEITLYEKEKYSRVIFDDLFGEIQKYENKYSRHVSESEITAVNNNAGRPVKVSDETIEIVRSSFSFSDMSEGLFDISIGPLVDLWDIKASNPHLPSEKEIEHALEKVDNNKVIIDSDNNTLFMSELRMSID